MRDNGKLWSNLSSRCGKPMQHDQFWFNELKSYRKDTSKGFGQVRLQSPFFWGRNGTRSKQFQLKMGD